MNMNKVLLKQHYAIFNIKYTFFIKITHPLDLHIREIDNFYSFDIFILTLLQLLEFVERAFNLLNLFVIGKHVNIKNKISLLCIEYDSYGTSYD